MKEPIKCRGGCERLFCRSHIPQIYCEICKPKSDEMEAVDDSESVASSYNDGALEGTQDEINGLKCLIASKDEKICELEKYVIQLKLIIAEKFIEACKSSITTTTAVAPGSPSPGKKITTQSPISYANLVSHRLTSPTETKESNEHSIILKPAITMTNNSKLNVEEINKIKRHIEKSISPTDIEFNISKIRPTMNGGVIMSFPSKQDQVNAIVKIRNEATALGFSTTEMNKKMPRIIIPNLPLELVENSEVFLATLTRQNPEIQILAQTEPLKVVTLLDTKFDTVKKVVLEVSPNIRKSIMKSQKIKLGMCMYTVFDHIHVIKCTKCCRFGHPERFCKSEKTTCGICAEDHCTTNCKGYKSTATEIIKKCVNCQSTSHGSDEKRKCPTYNYQIKKLQNKIEYNQNNYV